MLLDLAFHLSLVAMPGDLAQDVAWDAGFGHPRQVSVAQVPVAESHDYLVPVSGVA